MDEEREVETIRQLETLLERTRQCSSATSLSDEEVRVAVGKCRNFPVLVMWGAKSVLKNGQIRTTSGVPSFFFECSHPQKRDSRWTWWPRARPCTTRTTTPTSSCRRRCSPWRAASTRSSSGWSPATTRMSSRTSCPSSSTSWSAWTSPTRKTRSMR